MVAVCFVNSTRSKGKLEISGTNSTQPLVETRASLLRSPDYFRVVYPDKSGDDHIRNMLPFLSVNANKRNCNVDVSFFIVWNTQHEHSF